jgi:hypothetical protein
MNRKLDLMWSLIRGDPDVVIRFARLLILGGIFLGIAAARLEIPGTVAAFFAVGLGASGGSLIHWRTERGLWMLAVFFLVIHCLIFGFFTAARVVDIIQGAFQPDVGLIIDFGSAMLILSISLRFLSRIVRYNWAFSQRH